MLLGNAYSVKMDRIYAPPDKSGGYSQETLTAFYGKYAKKN